MVEPGLFIRRHKATAFASLDATKRQRLCNATAHGAGTGAERVADSSGRARGFRAAVREGAEAGRSRIQWARGGGWEKKGPCYIYEIYNVIILACAVQGVGWHQSRREWMRCGLGANGAGAEASQ